MIFEMINRGKKRNIIPLEIRSLDFHVEYGLLFVGLEDSLHVANINYISQDERLNISEFQETPISKIQIDSKLTDIKLESVTVDWLNDGVYICVKSSQNAYNQTAASQHQDNWSLVLCDLTLRRCHQMSLNFDVKPKYFTAGK